MERPLLRKWRQRGWQVWRRATLPQGLGGGGREVLWRLGAWACWHPALRMKGCGQASSAAALSPRHAQRPLTLGPPPAPRRPLPRPPGAKYKKQERKRGSAAMSAESIFGREGVSPGPVGRGGADRPLVLGQAVRYTPQEG